MARPRRAVRANKLTIPKELPILPSGDAVAFPAILIPLGTSNEKIVRLIDEAASGDRMVGIFAQRPGTEAPTPENLYSLGTAATIVRMFKMPDGSIRAFLQGQARIRMTKVSQTEPYIRARLVIAPLASTLPVYSWWPATRRPRGSPPSLWDSTFSLIRNCT